jgi:acetyltransferase
MLALAHVSRRAAFQAAGPRSVPDVAELLGPAGTLPEHESSLVLERLGVPFVPRRRAATAEEAAKAAAEIGTPVVVKADGLAHKARAGGVVLGVETPAAAGEAARRLGGGPVLVARQMEGGAEVLCGMTRDPDFGPILAVGRGGVDVEAIDSVVVSSAPLDVVSAAGLVAAASIDDPHGVVAATLVALGDLALANPRIAAVEVNPLIVTVSATIAVDALVVLTD